MYGFAMANVIDKPSGQIMLVMITLWLTFHSGNSRREKRLWANELVEGMITC